MRVLVTGGAGFIGSHLVERLLAVGDRVLVLDNFDPFYPEPIKRQNLAGCLDHPAFKLQTLDVCDAPAVAAATRAFGPDAIVHLAAKAGVRPSLEDPVAYQQANVQGTQNLLEAAHQAGVKQFVFASSSSVYGVNPNVPWREDESVLQPISPYAATKVAGELLGHTYSHLYGIRFVALRFFTVYGPRQRPDLAIHKFARRLLQDKPITLFGRGDSRRDYTYIDDIITGVCAAIDYRNTPYEVVNLGNHHAVGLLEMVAALERVFEKKAQTIFEGEQPGDVPQTFADITKASQLLGFCPRTRFEDGLAAFGFWLLRQPKEQNSQDRAES